MPTQHFKKKYSILERKEEAQRIRAKYPDRIPVIVDIDPKSSLPAIDKQKYLVPHDLSFGQFIYVIRKRIKLDPQEALFAFVAGKHLINMPELMTNVYERLKDEDGFLYITATAENTFGTPL